MPIPGKTFQTNYILAITTHPVGVCGASFLVPSTLASAPAALRSLVVPYQLISVAPLLAAYAVVRTVWCLSVCPAGCHLRALCRNGYRYGLSYYGMRIGNRTQAFEWYHFRLHYMFQGRDIIQRQITRKRYKEL